MADEQQKPRTGNSYLENVAKQLKEINDEESKKHIPSPAEWPLENEGFRNDTPPNIFATPSSLTDTIKGVAFSVLALFNQEGLLPTGEESPHMQQVKKAEAEAPQPQTE